MLSPQTKTFRYFTRRLRELGQETCSSEDFSVRKGGRDWEDYYRRRWQHDKVVRSTHGNNCTGSCSFDVFVKDGIIVWEAQKTDYPTPHPDFPDYEPRGCPRGTSASWYVYSPLRVRYPLMRGALWELWQQALQEHGDPVLAWESIVNNPQQRALYQQARGMGGFVRVSWDDAAELAAASLVHTIKRYGPDRIFGFTPLPAMSMASFASGARFFSMIGASMISFYDWYCDLPPASPQIWGEQTDVPESADWYNAGYIIAWGSNVPQTRTPDAHFFVEARYRGTRIAAVSPDYADFTKFADHWLPVRAGTDAALAIAMVHVVIKEFFLDRQVPYFQDYARRFTDLPCLVLLDENGEGRPLRSGRFIRATDLGRKGNNPEWKVTVFDTLRYGPAVPMGSIGSRYGEEGTWNLHMRDCYDGEELQPLLTMADHDRVTWELVDFPQFGQATEQDESATRCSAVPCMLLEIDGEIRRVTTVFDLLAGSVALDRGHAGVRGQVAKHYNDAQCYATPAWQEELTGVSRDDVIRVAREFAANAEETQGRSMIIMGAGINHWYHNDSIYRCILSLTSLCGCQGVSGGGWAHYVGQEKVRPLAGWTTLTMGSDWTGPPRLQNGTSFYYFATSAWRYELLDMQKLCSPASQSEKTQMPAHPADCNALAVRLGWLPFYPQFQKNSLDLCDAAQKDGADSDQAIIDHVVKGLVSGEVQMAVEDPDHPDNVPRVMCFWRTNPLGSNVKGHEYFLKHLLGTKNAVRGAESPRQPEDVRHRPADSQGKLDLMITSEFRMSTTCLYSDMVLPAAHWYEIHDLSSTDMHPFIHPFTPATDPPWEARNNWDQFKAIATAFSRLAAIHLGTRKDIVACPLLHDTPGEIAQPLGQVLDWRKGEVDAIPGKTMPSLHIVERHYPDVLKMYSALGPNIRKDKGVGAKGAAWNATTEHELLKQRLGVVTEAGCSQGMPRLDTDRAVCESILCLSPESNGVVSLRSWAGVEKLSGLSLSDLSAPTAGVVHTFESVTARPARALNSPNWSGIKGEQCTYSPFAQNVQRLLPFHTLSGRQHFYLDHAWMRIFGESLPVFRPALPLMRLGEVSDSHSPRTGKELVLNLLTPHSKWSIHSTYSDNLLMRTLSRGGGEIWLNDADAAAADIKDNEWLECYNANGVFMGRALVSHRIPPGRAFIYHAQERHLNTPFSPLSGTRGGTHNSLTRTFVKPTQMIGAYAQLSYGFNYYGPTGCQRDECIVIRKAGEVSFHEN